MTNFMYLFRHDPESLKTRSPEQMEQTMKKWKSWIEELSRDGHLKSVGERLIDSGKRVSGRSKTVTDGPFAESKDMVGGYMMVIAKDLAHAVELAKGCPILDTDGTVEVRPLMTF